MNYIGRYEVDFYVPKLVRYFWPGWFMQLLLRLHFVYRRLDWKGVYLHGPYGVGKSTVLEKSLVLCELGRW